MRSFKFLFLAAALTVSTTVLAYPTYGIEGRSNPGEIEKLLGNCRLSVDDEITVIVRFSLSERHEIQVHAVKSENEEVNQFLKERLDKQKLEGKKWHTGKLYEVPVKLRAAK